MTREQILLVVFAALMSVAPYWFLPARRRAWALADVATWVALAGSLASARALGIEIAPSLLLAIVMAAKLAHFFLWCALLDAEEVRWSPRAAAGFALAIFLVAGSEALRWPIDGDEPYYVLMAESLMRDRDLDLANQYAHLERSAAGRLDLAPQAGDPVGPAGERYPRHEPLLALLLIPGVAAGGSWGAMATIALLGALAVGSMMALARDMGAPRAGLLRAWPLVALGPPLLFYSIRIWPEVPAALCFSEAIRAAGKKAYARAAVWLVLLSLLQLRFAAVAAVFAVLLVIADRRARKLAPAAAAAVAIPLLIGWLVVGDPLNVHRWSELAPAPLRAYVRGGFGLLFDAQAGLLFQAPIWFAAVIFGIFGGFSVLRSPFSAAGRSIRSSMGGAAASGTAAENGELRTENGERGTSIGERRTIGLAAIAAIPYLILLAPRAEWHGGWSPPLRYLVVFAPLVAVGAARLLGTSRPWVAPAALWTAALAIHGVAFPWRLFHIASGESVLGAWLSVRFGSDVSRLLPSYIRTNGAAWAAAILFLAVVVGAFLARSGRATRSLDEDRAAERAGRSYWNGATVALALAAGITLVFAAGLQPGAVVHFEDAHVEHGGGLLDPEQWTVARFRFTGGWRLGEGESLRFRMRPGRALLHVRAEHGGVFETDGEPHAMPATGAEFIEVPVDVRSERSSIRVVRGAMTFDRIERTR